MIDFTTILQTAIVNAISGLIQNIFYIILVIWSIKTLVRQVPKWLSKYESIKEKERVFNYKVGLR